MEKLRALADEAAQKKGRPQGLAVRVPSHEPACAEVINRDSHLFLCDIRELSPAYAPPSRSPLDQHASLGVVTVAGQDRPVVQDR